MNNYWLKEHKKIRPLVFYNSDFCKNFINYLKGRYAKPLDKKEK